MNCATKNLENGGDNESKDKAGTPGVTGEGQWAGEQEKKGIKTRAVGALRHRDELRAGEQTLRWPRGEGRRTSERRNRFF